MALLCLLVGCKELEWQKDKPEEPHPCPLMAIMPLTDTSIYNLPKNQNYEIVVNNQILWNSCSRTSKFRIYAVTLSPGSTAYSLRIQSEYLQLSENTPVTVKVYPTDAQCIADATPMTVRDVQPNFSSQSNECGSTKTESYLYINILPDTYLPTTD